MKRKSRLERAIETVGMMQKEWSAHVRQHGTLDPTFMMQSLSAMYGRQYYAGEWPRVVVPQSDVGRELLDHVFCGEYDGEY